VSTTPITSTLFWFTDKGAFAGEALIWGMAAACCDPCTPRPA